MKKTVMAAIGTVCFGYAMLSAVPAQAQGGVNWKSTITNSSALECYVRILYALNTKRTDNINLHPGDSHTFEFGANCPDTVLAACHMNGYAISLESDMTGRSALAGLTPACFDTSLEIYKDNSMMLGIRKK